MEELGNTLGAVCTLIERVSGCRVIRSSLEGDTAVIDLAGERAVLVALQDVFEAANAEVIPWLRGPTESSSLAASQTVRASITRRDGLIAHGSLQLVGVHLVWRLHCDGQMSTREANGYLHDWCATPVEE